MFNEGKYSVLGINISAVDYAYTVQAVITAAEHGKPCSLSALAVHGVMTGVFDVVQNRRLNGLDFVVPDGQPVRWALHLLYGINLPDRVYGPDLTLKVLEAAALRGLPVFFYGSKPATLNRFVANIQSRYPELIIAGALPSAFRRLTPAEKTRVAGEIKRSDAKLVFVGLGCPRQEIWAFEYRGLLNMPILAVGAAFDFHAGVLPQAPPEWQRLGLEWLFRLIQEPKRLWRRYLFLNPLYLWGLFLQGSHLKRFAPSYPMSSPRAAASAPARADRASHRSA